MAKPVISLRFSVAVNTAENRRFASFMGYAISPLFYASFMHHVLTVFRWQTC